MRSRLFALGMASCLSTVSVGFAPPVTLLPITGSSSSPGSFFRPSSLLQGKPSVDAVVSAEKVLDPVEEQALEVRKAALSKNDDASAPLTSYEISARTKIQLEKLQKKDETSRRLRPEELTIVYEDENLVVCDKPSGVLSVPGRVKENPSINQAVFEAVGCEMGRMDMMIVHRLGMDTSGLMVFAKTRKALLEMNTVFRTRNIERRYEALVCGHVLEDSGIVDLPLMRDYEYPPFMRISTDDHQRALIDVDPKIVGKKLLELPKESKTKYEVISREELEGQPVTRVTLTSLTGRTHQLNVHMAVLGHPIVGDTTYGIYGAAAPNGGLTDSELETLIPNPNRVPFHVQQRIAKIAAAAENRSVSCVHAKSLKFRHPITKEDIDLSTDAPF